MVGKYKVGKMTKAEAKKQVQIRYNDIGLVRRNRFKFDAVDVLMWIVLLVVASVACWLMVDAYTKASERASQYVHQFEYETLDGKKGVARSCSEANKFYPQAQCELSDGTIVVGLKQWKEVWRERK